MVKPYNINPNLSLSSSRLRIDLETLRSNSQTLRQLDRTGSAMDHELGAVCSVPLSWEQRTLLEHWCTQVMPGIDFDKLEPLRWTIQNLLG